MICFSPDADMIGLHIIALPVSCEVSRKYYALDQWNSANSIPRFTLNR